MSGQQAIDDKSCEDRRNCQREHQRILLLAIEHVGVGHVEVEPHNENGRRDFDRRKVPRQPSDRGSEVGDPPFHIDPIAVFCRHNQYR